MSSEIDIHDYLLAMDDPLATGDKLRVRPWTPPAPAYNQRGPNTGTVLNGVKLYWGKPYTVTDGESDPEAGLISIELVDASRELFMTETGYQDYIAQTT